MPDYRELLQAPTVNINTTDIDVDLETDGIQVEEGTVIPITADINDDVQVRNAELLLNGEVIKNDVSFPWDFSVVAPAITTDSDTATLQVRATDTGGNATLSDPIILNLIPDDL